MRVKAMVLFWHAYRVNLAINFTSFKRSQVPAKNVKLLKSAMDQTRQLQKQSSGDHRPLAKTISSVSTQSHALEEIKLSL